MDSDSDARLTDVEDDDGMSDYEEERKANIKRNAELMASLGLNSETKRVAPSTTTPKKPVLSSAEERTRREMRIKAAALKRVVEPTRRSSRVAAKESEVKSEDPSTPSYVVSPATRRPDPLPRKAAPVIPSGPAYNSSEPLPRAPRPGRAEDGTLIFEGRWKDVFTPNITPEEMFAGGAFAGAFFCDTHSHVLRQPLVAADDIASLPFTLPDSDADRLLSNPEPDGDLNRFRVRAGQSLAEWEKAGWIWGEDPRGWAQWYTRFWDGRRCEDDERQVRRWLKVAGPTGRFKRALLKKIHLSGGEAALADEDVGRVLRQCLWQWGYELTESEYRRAMEE